MGTLFFGGGDEPVSHRYKIVEGSVHLAMGAAMRARLNIVEGSVNLTEVQRDEPGSHRLYIVGDSVHLTTKITQNYIMIGLVQLAVGGAATRTGITKTH